MSGFVTRVEREKEEPFTVIFTTDDHSKYIHIENECRKMIDHAKPTTNGDRIRAMTDEELAGWLSDMHDSVTCPNDGAIDCNPSCKRCWLDWLKEEVDDE